jgi:hypothetical protein
LRAVFVLGLQGAYSRVLGLYCVSPVCIWVPGLASQVSCPRAAFPRCTLCFTVAAARQDPAGTILESYETLMEAGGYTSR